MLVSKENHSHPDLLLIGSAVMGNSLLGGQIGMIICKTILGLTPCRPLLRSLQEFRGIYGINNLKQGDLKCNDCNPLEVVCTLPHIKLSKLSENNS